MKRAAFIILALIVFLPVLYAQAEPGAEETEEIKIIKIEKEIEKGDEDVTKVITRAFNPVQSDVYFGIYVEDIDEDSAGELGYEYSHGILITGVVKDSPAWNCQLKANDVMMKLDEEEVTDLMEFDRIRSELAVGDEVMLSIWREGAILNIPMTMQPRPERSSATTGRGRKDGKLSPGYGGGSWIPYWFITDVDDVNDLIEGLIGESGAINDQGIFVNGGAGKGHVGKGIFIGGLGAGYTYSQDLPERRTSLVYSSSFWGVTLDKRIPVTNNFITSLGVLIGGGGHEVQYSETDNSFVWPDVDSGNNFSANIHRNFVVVQPKVELMYRLLSWFALRAEVGYIYGIPTYNGWYVTDINDNNYKIEDSPDTTFQGLSFSVGPWFGF
ncbi:MAG: PDZ domain-containing protein [Candidatus Syntrophosphaera sp.]